VRVSACVCVRACVWLCDLHLENDGLADATPSVVLTRGEDSIVLLPADTMREPPFRSSPILCADNSLRGTMLQCVKKNSFSTFFSLFPFLFLCGHFHVATDYSNVCWHKSSSLAVLSTS
jgi:hypothetical protein